MTSTRAENVLEQLKIQANPMNVAGMARYGINTNGTLGISIPVLRKTARQIGTDHDLAQELWDSGIHEARMLAAFIADPDQTTEDQMESWVNDFDSWDVCDQVCSNLFDRTPYAVTKAIEWVERDETFIRRAGFVLMASLAVHNKKMTDSQFEEFFPLIINHSNDERNFVKKAINWALRQIGKRNLYLNQAAVDVARQLRRDEHRSTRWIGSDAERELTSEKTLRKFSR